MANKRKMKMTNCGAEERLSYLNKLFFVNFNDKSMILFHNFKRKMARDPKVFNLFPTTFFLK